MTLFNSSKMLKSLQPALCLPISILINKSMETGQVPANMKIAKIIPIYKSKEKNNMGNYRPISFYHQSRKFWKKLLIKDHMAFVKLSIFFMITNTDVGRNIPYTIDAVSKFSAHVMSSLEDNLNTLAVFSPRHLTQ